MKIDFQLLSRLVAQPWAIRREAFPVFAEMLTGEGRVREVMRERILAGGTPTGPTGETPVLRDETPQAGYVPLNDEAEIAVRHQALPAVPENVTVALVWGILGRAWTAMDRWWYDAVEVDEITAAVEAAPEKSTVVLWFRSPGGIITGVPETAAALRQLGKKRKLIAFTDDLCASAAYWLASQCSRIVATPTADVGSIGVYIGLYDFCAMLAQRGIKLELFRAGDMKAMGLPGNPLSAKDRAHLQAGVDEGYAQFTKDVTNMRAISVETMQGQTLRGGNARTAKLVDEFVDSARAFFARFAQ